MAQRCYLITGAAGFVGRRLVDEVHAHGVRVRAFVRTPEQAECLEKAGAETRIGDIRDRAALEQAMSGANGVYHIAALFRQADQPDRVYYDINADGVRNVFEAALATGVPRIVHCSTVGVLGHVETPPANEDTDPNPGDIYQRSKLEGERIALDYFRSGRIRGVVIRPAMIYGPGDERTLKLFRMIARRRFFYVGRGDNLVHFVDVRDLARAFRLAMEREEHTGKVYIVAGAQAMTLRELTKKAAAILDVPPPRLCIPVRPMQALGSMCEAICKPLGIPPPLYRRRVDFFTKDRSFDTQRSREDLGFAPARTADEELRDIIEAYRREGRL